MSLEIWTTRGKREISFSSSDFLEEAIDDFLESGARCSRIASAIIKVATGVELLVKDYLERICPALILDKIDDAGLQVAKVFELGKRMRSPKELDAVELKTASFPVLLLRATTFLDIAASIPHLHKLHKMRNSLLHHRGKIDLLEINLLLVKHVFPFVEHLGKLDKRLGLRISDETWERIRKLEHLSVGALGSQLAKKIAHHTKIAGRISGDKIALLSTTKPELVEPNEQLVEGSLICPACENETLAAFQEVDIDIEDGAPVGGSVYFSMRCRVCDLELEGSEIEHIIANFKEYVSDDEKEKEAWKQSIELDEFTGY